MVEVLRGDPHLADLTPLADAIRPLGIPDNDLTRRIDAVVQAVPGSLARLVIQNVQLLAGAVAVLRRRFAGRSIADKLRSE